MCMAIFIYCLIMHSLSLLHTHTNIYIVWAFQEIFEQLVKGYKQHVKCCFMEIIQIMNFYLITSHEYLVMDHAHYSIYISLKLRNTKLMCITNHTYYVAQNL